MAAEGSQSGAAWAGVAVSASASNAQPRRRPTRASIRELPGDDDSVTMAHEVTQPLDVGVGVIGYAFMGKAHTNALKTLPYMIYPTPALPRLAAIAGRDLQELQAAAERFGYQAY